MTYGKMDTMLIVYISVLICLLSEYVRGQYSDSRCHHTLWSDGIYEYVTEVKVDCQEGHVTWNAPYGAIRITMQLRTKKGSQFQGCFLATASVAKAKISLEKVDSRVKDKNKLIPLVILNEKNYRTRKEVCIKSENSQVVLYVEVEPNGKTRTMGKIHIDYDIERLYNRLTFDNMEDCQPCSENEILNAYCSSDFVVDGSMEHVSHDKELQETSLHLKIDRIVRQKTSRFRRHLAGGRRNTDVVISPSKCGITHGPGQFMFTGRIRLGKAILQCAPFIDEFEEIKKKALLSGTHPCQLK